MRRAGGLKRRGDSLAQNGPAWRSLDMDACIPLPAARKAVLPA